LPLRSNFRRERRKFIATGVSKNSPLGMNLDGRIFTALQWRKVTEIREARKMRIKGMNKLFAMHATDDLHDFYHRKYVKLYDAAQEALSEMRYGNTKDAERILLHAGVADPDAEPQNEPDRKEED
jgi:hypothetical protein